MVQLITPTVANAFTPFQQTLTLSVPENWVKYRNFGILAMILLVVGLGGGLVIGGRQQIQPGEIAPARVRLLLSGAIGVAIAALFVAFGEYGFCQAVGLTLYWRVTAMMRIIFKFSTFKPSCQHPCEPTTAANSEQNILERQSPCVDG